MLEKKRTAKDWGEYLAANAGAELTLLELTALESIHTCQAAQAHTRELTCIVSELERLRIKSEVLDGQLRAMNLELAQVRDALFRLAQPRAINGGYRELANGAD